MELTPTISHQGKAATIGKMAAILKVPLSMASERAKGFGSGEWEMSINTRETTKMTKNGGMANLRGRQEIGTKETIVQT